MSFLKKAALTSLSVLIVAIGYLAGYVNGTSLAYDRFSWQRMKNAAEWNVRFLTGAITNYFGRTGAWPCSRNGLADVTFGKEAQQGEVLAILLGLDPLRSVPGGSLLTIDREALVGNEYLDPWGAPYCIVFDTDGDGMCKTARWGTLSGRGPFIWSEAGGAITSWQSPSNSLTPPGK